MHNNICNEGKYSGYIFEEVPDDHTMPIIYTPEEDDAIMKEFNETMWIPDSEPYFPNTFGGTSITMETLYGTILLHT